ncbi:MAG TPA: sulfite exporter TauE/SafE family protein, partial [Dehalococcoidia bacterium]|nr:sulfite exporter TauE/SafE family protein [Dehalococcoidia bacterium]
MPPLLLVPLGLVVGAYGTLIGAGGGFLLVPALLFLYPHERPATITSVSLAVVFFNATSGSLAYARQGRIDYRTGIRFALATAPGALLGARVATHLSRGVFDVLFGAAMVAVAGFVVIRSQSQRVSATAPQPGMTMRVLTDARGETYMYRFWEWKGIVLSAGVG